LWPFNFIDTRSRMPARTMFRMVVRRKHTVTLAFRPRLVGPALALRPRRKAEDTRRYRILAVLLVAGGGDDTPAIVATTGAIVARTRLIRRETGARRKAGVSWWLVPLADYPAA
jgi:hypothetical protein